MNIETTVLDRLTASIQNDIERRRRGEEEWIEASIDLCVHLAEAREEFPDNISFGNWFAASGIHLNDHDRAAAIAMGKDIDLAREVLTNTSRRSLQHIHLVEFRSAHVSKTEDIKKTKGGAPSKVALKVEKAYQHLKTAAATTDPRTEAEVTGLPINAMEKALQRVAEEKTAQLHAEIEAASAAEEATLSATAAQKLEAAIARHQKKLDQEFDHRVKVESERFVNDVLLPLYGDKIDQAEMILRSRKGVFPRHVFRKILACLHPDQSMGQETRNECFEAMKRAEVMLVSEERKMTGTLPKTREEMYARKAKMDAERRAKRSAK